MQPIKLPEKPTLFNAITKKRFTPRKTKAFHLGTHRQVEIVKRGDALSVVTLTSPATPFAVRHAVQRAKGSRLDQHLRKVAGL